MSKVRTLFVIDAIIGLAFIVTGASAVAFLVPFSAIDFATASAAPTFLGLGYGVWHSMHLYSGLVMLVGGMLHIEMHFSWMVNAFKGLLPASKSKAPKADVAKDAA